MVTLFSGFQFICDVAFIIFCGSVQSRTSCKSLHEVVKLVKSKFNESGGILVRIRRAVAAQSGSALRRGCRGREFKSRRPRPVFILSLQNERHQNRLVSTGVMGTPMIKHFLMQVLKFRFSAICSRAESLEENGAIWKDSPAQLAQDVEIIFSMLGYPSDVESVLLGKKWSDQRNSSTILIIFASVPN